MQLVLPRHLRPRRDKIFGPAPSHRLDGNAKARVWTAATASGGGTLLSDAERAALIARPDTNPTKADWALYDRDLDARLTATT
jgi:hypothetical protein